MKKLFLCIALLWAIPSQAAYTYKKLITVNSAMVPSTQTDFPVLVYVTDADFKDTNHTGKVTSTSGNDIAFFSDSGLTSALACERDYYNGTAGTIAYWVKIASLSDTSTFYIGFGDSGIASNQCASTSTWNSGFKGVYHFGDGTALTLTDSTIGANTAAKNGAFTFGSGIIAGSAHNTTAANGNNLVITGLFSSPATVTASLWFKTTSSGNQEGISIGDAVTVRIHDTFSGSTGVRGSQHITADPFFTGLKDTTAYNNGSWHYASFVANPSGSSRVLYIDGISRQNDALATAIDYTGVGSDTYLGQHGNGGNNGIIGDIDEVHIQNVARSADWVWIDYQQRPDSGFLAYGPTEIHEAAFPLYSSTN